MNPYKILNVKKKATQAEIRRAYIELSKQYHPDVEGGSQERFVEIQRAYEILKDENLRSVFDETGTVPGDMANIIHTAAVTNLMQMFNDFMTHIPLEQLNQADLPAMMRGATQDIMRKENIAIANLERKKRDLAVAREVIENKIKRKKNKKSQHLFLLAIDNSIATLDSEILPKKQKTEVMVKAIELLDEYEFQADEIRSIGFFGGSIFTGQL